MCLIDSDIVFDENVSQPVSVENRMIRIRIGTTAYIVDGFTIQIVCNATSMASEQSVIIRWRRNGKDDRTRGNVSMIIVTDANHGDVFTCVAKNKLGDNNRRTTKIIFANKHFCI